MASKRVLIVDCQFPSIIISKQSWSNFIDDDNDDTDLYIFTSNGALSETDKISKYIRVYKEVPDPTTDGTLELWALEMHRKHVFTHIYTKCEELIFRVAHLRSLLKIKTGLTAETVAAYREKVCMKEIAQRGGFPVPKFARLYSPSDLIDFIEKNKYPVIIKPTLGRGTSGIHLIKNENELEIFLSSKLFSCIDINQRTDLVGEFIVEQFINGRMFHVNGIAKNGRIMHIWPFNYINTCLAFCQGTAYGNSSIPQSNLLYNRLYKTAQRLLDIFPTPSDVLNFHLELFENLDKNRLPNDDFILCEISGRGPGGSIRHLINLLCFENDTKESYARLDFRASISLSIPKFIEEDQEKVVTDLIVPFKQDQFIYIPRQCPIDYLVYTPIGEIGKALTYKKYNINGINSACRFVAITKTKDEGQKLVEKGLQWFENVCINISSDES
ncbi:unnamed protein product [Adineta ricciae]|uniref:ATP-grasp domain-containing protein n=1 Tax=Adineta ricciae TaxID=249248 RepID=A0A815CGP2_ADIRI|nr:unnamed protein product [Adineta ricciae]CAF1287032.1 unnamed protein product [Adineta ricciae]